MFLSVAICQLANLRHAGSRYAWLSLYNSLLGKHSLLVSVVAGWDPLIKQIGTESTACQQSASHAESRQKSSTRSIELILNQQLHAHVLGMGIGASARVCSRRQRVQPFRLDLRRGTPQNCH